MKRVSKAEWLQTALKLLESDGVEAVHVERIARELGISKSGFYWHFKDRDDLRAQMIDYWAHEFTGVVTANPLLRKGDPRKRLEQTMQMILEHGRRYRGERMKTVGATILSGVRIAMVLCAFVPSAFAEPETTRPPSADRGPTKIDVVMVLLDVDEIDSANQSFVANLLYELRWQDARLAHEGPGRRAVPLDEIWHPQLLFVNQQKIWPTFPEVARVSPGGDVLYRQRIWGPFSQPLEVQDFPFDTQVFEMRLACSDARPAEVNFETDPEIPSGLAPAFSLPDWQILGWELEFEPYRPVARGDEAASIALVLHARRYSKPLIVKVVLPLLLIVAMSWLIFWIDPKEAGTQIGVATTSMLTLIAYRFMVGGSLPPVPYLTRMDFFILGSTVLVFMALVLSVGTSFMTAKGRGNAALRVDRYCRFVFPAAFAAVVIFSLVV